MADIRLDLNEAALWNEVGSRGDAFRAATRDRAAERVRLTGKMTEVITANDGMVDAVAAGDPIPESAADSPAAPKTAETQSGPHTVAGPT